MEAVGFFFLRLSRGATSVLSSIFLLFLLVLACLSCSSDANKTGKTLIDQQITSYSPEINEVEIIVLKKEPFTLELFTNGTVEAVRKADLNFLTEGIILPFELKEGQSVQKGQPLAYVDHKTQLTQQQQAQLEWQRAQLDYEDYLLRLGYAIQDTARLDLEVKRIARIRSGLEMAELSVEKAKAQLDQVVLVAPFSGKIANLQAKPYNSTSEFDFFCTLVDDQSLQVSFKILEQEVSFVEPGQLVFVKSFSLPNQVFSGKVNAINPLVDNNGMVTVKADMLSSGQHATNLLDGMGVQVIVQKTTIPALMLPKEAVLERQGRKVVFIEQDGLALWNYVEILYENQNQFALKSGLQEGDRVIVKGHFNLAHEHPVIVK